MISKAVYVSNFYEAAGTSYAFGECMGVAHCFHFPSDLGC